MANLRWWTCHFQLFLCCCQLIALSSSLPPPASHPTHKPPSVTSQLSAVRSGLQVLVLLPEHHFTPNSSVTSIHVGVKGPDTALSLQIWRPLGQDNFELRWQATHTSSSPGSMLAMNRTRKIIFADKHGVLVEPGDILGLYIPPSEGEKRVSVVYHEVEEEDQGTAVENAYVYYLEDVAFPYCHLALCNESMKLVTGVMPSIEIKMSDLSGLLEEDDSRQNLEKDPGQCTDNPPLLCKTPAIYYDDPGTRPLNSTSKGPSNANTSDLTNTTLINTASTSDSADNEAETTLLPLHSTRESHSALPRSSALNGGGVETSTEMGEDGSDGGGGDITTAAVAFIVIGAIFFIVLVILIIILCICLCPRKSTTRKTFVPAPPPQSGSCYRTNLVVSSSVEQSNGSSSNSDSTGPTTLHAHLHKLRSNHTYANAEISQQGDFRPFTPIYMNSDDESMRELLSEKSSRGSRSREGRGWSIGSTQGDRIHHQRPQQHRMGLPSSASTGEQLCAHAHQSSREGRGWSAGPPSQLSTVHNQSMLSSRFRRGGSVDRVLLGRVNSQHKREGQGQPSSSAHHQDKVQQSNPGDQRGSSTGPSHLDKIRSQLHLGGRRKRSWSVGQEDKVQSPPGREERALPATPGERQGQGEEETSLEAMRRKRAGRAKSVSATTRYKVDHDAKIDLPRPRSYSSNLSSVLSKPLPLPPFSVPPPMLPLLRRSDPQLNTRLVPPPTHTPPPPIPGHTPIHAFVEASGDYTTPVPVSERYKYDPKLRQEQAMDMLNVPPVTRPFVPNRSHDYSDPDEPEDEASGVGPLQDRYDHLTPPDSAEVHPEGQGVPALQALSEEMEEQGYAQGYVPNKEQRRMMQLHYNGHYEIDDDIGTKFSDGYDHLSFFKEADTYWAPAATAEDLYTQLSEYKYRELPRREISILNSIGSGHFGTVRKGVWCNMSTAINVAIKTVKNSTEQERVKLLQEAAIMGQFAHKYVVRLLGVVTVGEPVLVILEYMQKGDLHSFLQKLHPRVSSRDLPDVVPRLFVKFSKDIANGMSYLAKKCFIHRDLAARNILLNDELTCKIGDFGMARDIESEGDYYRSHGGIIPVKWTAPEALHYNKYSSASDVWSYGMVLFEIWSLGEKPFSELSNPIVIALVSSKHCQPPPPGCPRPVYHLMVECWNPDHAQRPTFDSIYDYLDSPEESLLQWHDRDIVQDKLAHVLGAPLEEANNLYLDLQRTYQKPLV